ncbi:MAG: hypothetical protein ABGW78_14940 [Pirellulales bacterium]
MIALLVGCEPNSPSLEDTVCLKQNLIRCTSLDAEGVTDWMTHSESSQSYKLPSRGLPLTAFEEHMLLDDRPSHPMTIVARFDFTDDVPPSNLEEAFSNTLAEEPLLTAGISKRRLGRDRWIAAEKPLLKRTYDARSVTMPGWCGVTPDIDPYAGKNLHAEVIEYNDGWSIFLTVHHAVSDGLGIVGFVERWLLNTENKPHRWKRPAHDTMSALLSRGRIANSWTDFLQMAPKLSKGLEGVAEFIRHDVIDLAHIAPSQSGDGPPSIDQHPPYVLSHVVEPTTLTNLEGIAKTLLVSVNDLLATALIITLGEYVAGEDVFADHPPHAIAQNEWIRLAIPMSLRTKSDHVLPATNRVSMIFLDRQPADRSDHRRLATSIRDQMDIIRNHHLGHIFPMSLECGRLLPGGLARTVNRPKPQCTAVFSNLGKWFHRSSLADHDGVSRIGKGKLSRWWAVPPVRPGTAIAACSHETCGERVVAFRVDPNRVKPEPANTILKRMIALLQGFSAPPANSQENDSADHGLI